MQNKKTKSLKYSKLKTLIAFFSLTTLSYSCEGDKTLPTEFDELDPPNYGIHGNYSGHMNFVEDLTLNFDSLIPGKVQVIVDNWIDPVDSAIGKYQNNDKGKYIFFTAFGMNYVLRADTLNGEVMSGVYGNPSDPMDTSATVFEDELPFRLNTLVLDVDFSGTCGFWTSIPNGAAQSFTGSLSGELQKVALGLTLDTLTTGLIRIYEGEGCSGSVLATQAFSFNKGSLAMYEVQLEDAPYVNAGQSYTIDIEQSSGFLRLHGENSFNCGGSYPNGTGYTNCVAENFDYYIQTYVLQ